MDIPMPTEAGEFFRSTPNLYLSPIGYTMTLGMLITRWYWKVDGTYAGRLHIRFDGCHYLRTEWQGSLGPYNMRFEELDDGTYEIRDETSEFRVICDSVHAHPSDKVPIYWFHLHGPRRVS